MSRFSAFILPLCIALGFIAPLTCSAQTSEDDAALNEALQEYNASIPTRIDDGADVIATAVINQDTGEATTVDSTPNLITMDIDGNELTFNYLEEKRHMLKAYSYFTFEDTHCATLLAEKIERYNILHWSEAQWQSYVRKYNYGNSAVGDQGTYVTCDTVDRAFVIHTLEPLLAVHTEDGWKAYNKPPELFGPDGDMQYLFEQRWEQQRDKLMERYKERKR